MKFQQLALLSTFLVVVSAKIKITTPGQSTAWEFGKKNTVKWIHESNDKGSLDLNLFFTKGVNPEKFIGEPVVSMTVEDITKDTAEFDLSKLDLDQFPPSSKDYFLRFGDYKGSYSQLFTINGGKDDNYKPADNINNLGNNYSNSTNGVSNATNNSTVTNGTNGSLNSANNSTVVNYSNNDLNAVDNSTMANNNNSTVVNNTNGILNSSNNGNVGNSQTTTSENNTANQVNTTQDTSDAEKIIATSFFAVIAAVAFLL